MGEPKKLFSALPVLYVSGIIRDQMPKLSKELFGAHGPYDCPVYKYRPRTDRFFIFFVTLKCTVDKNKKYWDLRARRSSRTPIRPRTTRDRPRAGMGVLL